MSIETHWHHVVCKICGEEFDSRRSQCPATAAHHWILNDQTRQRANLPDPGAVLSALVASAHQWQVLSMVGYQPTRVRCRMCGLELEIKQLDQVAVTPPCRRTSP